jgi:hypothetical protein
MYAMRQSLRPGDRSRYRFPGNNLPQRAFGTYLAGGFVEGRSLWLSLRKAAARSNRKPGSHHKKQNFLQGRVPRLRNSNALPNYDMSLADLYFLWVDIVEKRTQHELPRDEARG